MFIPIIAIVAVVLLLIFNNPATRLCRWRERRQGGMTHWTCVYCGATLERPQGERPRKCHRKDTEI